MGMKKVFVNGFDTFAMVAVDTSVASEVLAYLQGSLSSYS
mgnify:CR=1 FL=1